MTLIPFEVLSVTQTWKWRTGINKSRSGLETRIAYLQSPVESWKIQVAVDAELDRRDLRLALFQDPVSTWDLPLKYAAIPVQQEITGVNIFVDATLVDWITVGRKVYVEGPKPSDHYQTTILGSLGSLGTLEVSLADSPPAGDFPAKLTRISPIVEVYLDDMQPTNRSAAEGTTREGLGEIGLPEGLLDQGAGTWTISARSASFETTFGTGASVTTFDGIPVFDRQLLGEADAEEKFVADLQRDDYGAVISQEWFKSFADIGRSHLIELEGDEDRQWTRKFFHDIYGQQVAFLLPTWQPDVDLSPAALILPGWTQLLILQNPGLGAWFQSAGHGHVQFLDADGTVAYGKITAVVDNLDGTETVTFSAHPGITTIARISLLELVRLGDDSVSFEHTADTVSFELSALVVQR